MQKGGEQHPGCPSQPVESEDFALDADCNAEDVVAQDMPSSGKMGVNWFVQLAPWLLVARIELPAAKHVVVVGQLIAAREALDPVGLLFQVLPPFVVTRTGFPAAKQTVVLGQLMPARLLLFTESCTPQVAPPFVVARIWPPPTGNRYSGPGSSRDSG
jgi:hypothetical protein